MATDNSGSEGFLAQLQSRRSVRELAPDRIDTATVLRLIDAACAAPSAHHSQPWRIVIVHSQECRVELARLLSHRLSEHLHSERLAPVEVKRRVARVRRRLLTAPLTMVVCLAEQDIPLRSTSRLADAEQTMANQSTALAAGWLLLGAHGLGLAACWYSAPLFLRDDVRAVLDLPPTWDPQALLLIGKPARPNQSPAQRRSPNEAAIWV
jgi:coenzyme F420-0:L-glutamate ligase / coenzyme F420-1:gamma-L-glutamate ligase